MVIGPPPMGDVAQFRADVQGLRAIAVCLVVAYHAGLIGGGFIGVDAFFVISGFVIARSVAPSLGDGSFRLSEFLGRRVRRLLPALGVVVATTLLLSTWLSVPAARVQTVRTGIASSFSAANTYLYRFRPEGYFENGEKANALLHTWSLSAEEQFFLIFGATVALLAALVRRRGDGVRRPARLVLVAGLALSFAACMAASYRWVPEFPGDLGSLLGPSKIGSELAFYAPVTRAWQFLVGVAIVAFPRMAGARMARLPAVAGCVMVLSGALVVGADGYPGIVALVPTLGTALVIEHGSAVAPLRRVLEHPVARWIGDRSYGIYLWHWPLIVFLRPLGPASWWPEAVAIALSGAAAAASYTFVEQPIRRGASWRLPRRTLGVLACSVALPLVVATTSRDLAPELAPHLDRQSGCEYGAISSLEPGGRCTFPADDSVGRAVLVGDSHAGMLSTGFVGAANALGFDAVLAIDTGAAFLLPSDADERARGSAVADVVSRLVADPPVVVVVAQSIYGTDRDGRSVEWAAGFEPILDELAAAGVPVVVASTTFFPYADPQECSPLQARLGWCAADRSFDADAARQETALRRNEEQQVVARSTNAVWWDVSRDVCPDTPCAVRRDGTWWWRDRTHLSRYASEQLSGAMQDAMRRAFAAARG